MLGDSITFGTRVRDFETFSYLLEHRSARYEVVNLAVEGYGTDQELLLLEDEGLRYHPDVVVLNVCVANDPLDNFLPELVVLAAEAALHLGRTTAGAARRTICGSLRLAVRSSGSRTNPTSSTGCASCFLSRSEPSLFPPVRGEWRRFDRQRRQRADRPDRLSGARRRPTRRGRAAGAAPPGRAHLRASFTGGDDARLRPAGTRGSGSRISAETYRAAGLSYRAGRDRPAGPPHASRPSPRRRGNRDAARGADAIGQRPAVARRHPVEVLGR